MENLNPLTIKNRKCGVRENKQEREIKTAINRCITRKHPLNGNPNLQSVNELTVKGCCKERSDGIAIATLASIASKVRRDLAQF